MDVREVFGAAVDVRGPDPGEWGYFLVRRRADVEHEGFLRFVSSQVGGDDFVVVDSPGGIVVVAAPFRVAQGLTGHPVVSHVGGVTIDAERLREAFADPTGTMAEDRTTVGGD